jgi:hypothetical protein
LVVGPSGPPRFAFLFRREVEGTVAEAVLKYGTGGLNIDACRVVTSSGDAKAMERCNTPGSGRMFDSASPIGTFIRSSSSGPLDTSKGRWPTNLVFIHGEGCTRDGVKRVKAISGGNNVTRNSREVAESEDWWGHGRVQKQGERKGQGDENGNETIPNWICTPSCPVRALDEQSGLSTSSSDPTRFKGVPKFKGTSYAEDVYSLAMGRGDAQAYGDTGGASRFFPQFENESALITWLKTLIGAA